MSGSGYGAREEMAVLKRMGYEAYRSGQRMHAASLYGRALKIAEALNDVNAIVRFRFWRATALASTGQLRQALALLTPTLQDTAGEKDDVYNTLTEYISIAQSLPVALASIEKALAQAEDYINRVGHPEWRHKLLYLRSSLYAERGLYQEALHYSQESWAVWTDEYPCYVADAHMQHLVHRSLMLRDGALARAYLEEWARQENAHPRTRERLIYSRRAELARLEGRFQEAVDFARRASLIARQQEMVTSAEKGLMAAYLAAGEIEAASTLYFSLLKERHSEIGHERYLIQRLRGDFYLACARHWAGMPPRDDHYSLEFPLPESVLSPEQVRRSLIRARRAYHTAYDVGCRIDALLESTLRQEEVEGRLARVAALWERL